MKEKIIKIATWNVSEGISASWNLSDGVKEPNCYQETDLIKQIVEKINIYDLDIVCFQEFPVEIEGKFLLKDYIFNNTRLKFCSMHETSPSFLFKNGKVGVAIFSKYNIINEQKTYFENPNLTKMSKTGQRYKSFDKGIVLAKVNINEKVINVITGHAIAFAPFDKKAEDFPQSYKPLSDLICKIIDNNETLVACGDFNTEVLFDLIPEINTKVHDIITGATTPATIMEGKYYNDGRKLDYILISDKIKKIRVEKIENLSDHYLCIADILI
ncbi:MAG: endonuclease/exonuclease/phosphatase family protein [Bacilli bacterium]|nr:endonuclease/exonuclease/phosphatase family protein [Bacilli bacterium]